MSQTQTMLFLVASLAVIATPGQDMVLVISRSIAHGAKAGIITAAGISTGLLGHTLLAAFGLGALLRTSEVLFTSVKLIGAVYLVYLGVRLIFSRNTGIAGHHTDNGSLSRLFWQGALSNISNPKVTIFYFAFLPQFVPVGTTHVSATLLILGAVFSLLTFAVKAPVGYGAGNLSSWLIRHPRVQVLINRFSGLVLVGLGVRLALERRM